MSPPFDAARLDTLMDAAGLDVLIATAKENVRYLLGGYQTFLFAYKDSLGLSRHHPCVGYVKGTPENAFYVGCALDNWQQEVEPFWIEKAHNTSWTSESSAKEAAACIRKLGFDRATAGIERSFAAADFLDALRCELPNLKCVEAHPLLDELRAVKRPVELAYLREASETIVESMLAVMHGARVGTTTRELADRLMREEVSRGLSFEYCLPCAGVSFNRAPSDAQWRKGEILSLDSGGNRNGYIGDLCRMAVMGAPTPLMRDLLDEVRAVQSAARGAVRAGVTGREIFERARAEQAKCAHAKQMVFLAHGMGMIQHEAPHLTHTGVIPYPGIYEDKPIRANMVLSIETDLKSPEAGFVKLEDTVVVTANGYEAYGDGGRDWNVVEC